MIEGEPERSLDACTTRRQYGRKGLDEGIDMIIRMTDPGGDGHHPAGTTPARRTRLRARAGEQSGPTSGLAPGYMQGNLIILPSTYTADFLGFCHLNPKPCPLIGLSACGDPHIPSLGADLDVRTDLPRYHIWNHGEVVDEPTDILRYWRDDLVAFVLGCSFSFDEALIAEGIRLRHIERGSNVSMYRTSIECAPMGPFRGPLVVSMRPMKPAEAIRAVQVTSRFPALHGAPVHLGLPELIGIHDLSRPDYGDSVPIAADELPVFWACGVTPQAALATAALPFAITHAPGHMLVTDRRNSHAALF
jgi:uncharacterized protein YcsI (UPF0317 family)